MHEYDSEIAQDAEQAPPKRRRRLNAPVVFGVITLLLVVVVLAGAELFFQWRGFPYEPDSLLRPHFVDAGAGLVETNPFLAYAVETAAYPQKFPREKPPGTLRLAILGGSNVFLLQDAPALKQWLVVQGCAGSEDDVELLNMGVCGCGSDRAVLSARQALEYDLDALLVYSGHNEFISESNYNTYRQPSWLARNSKVVQLFAGNAWQPEPGRFYTEQEKEQVYAQFEKNLRSIVAMARDAGVPVIFGTVSANLALPPKVYDPNVYSLDEVPPEPLQHYRRGLELLSQSQIDEAREAFQKSIDDSPRPWRATSRINEVLRTTAAELSVPVADVEQHVLEKAPEGIPGMDTSKEAAFDPYRNQDGLFRDYCHLNERGRNILFETFARVLSEELPKEKKSG